MKTKYSLALASGLSLSSLSAQVFFGDSEGQTSLIFPIPPEKSKSLGGNADADNFDDENVVWSGWGLGSLGFTDSRVSAGYFLSREELNEDGNSSVEKWLGFTLSAAASNGYASLFKDGDIAGDLTANLYFGERDNPGRTKPGEGKGWDEGWWTYKIGYTHASYTLLDPVAAPGSEISRSSEHLYDLGVIYTTQVNAKTFGGFSFGFRKQSNYDALSKKTFKQVTPVGSGFVVKETVAREGNLAFRNEWYLDMDVLRLINSSDTSVLENSEYTPAVSLFARLSYSDGDFYASPGLGLFLVKANDAIVGDMLGGLTVKFDDETNDLQVGLTSGFRF
ncbi:MAG: hypothetical protein ACN4GG_11755 [Akkermansiaceae bacterium]